MIVQATAANTRISTYNLRWNINCNTLRNDMANAETPLAEAPLAETSSASKNTLRRFDLKTDILLAIMPAIAMVGVLISLHIFGKQDILFSSLASSAFLIYLDPKHPTNSVRTLIIAQVSAAVIGYFVFLLAGSGYVSAGISMVLSIVVMILAKAMHPPAVSTALLFAFQYTKANTLLIFVCAVALLVILIVLQHLSLWLIRKSEQKKPAL